MTHGHRTVIAEFDRLHALRQWDNLVQWVEAHGGSVDKRLHPRESLSAGAIRRRYYEYRQALQRHGWTVPAFGGEW